METRSAYSQLSPTRRADWKTGRWFHIISPGTNDGRKASPIGPFRPGRSGDEHDLQPEGDRKEASQGGSRAGLHREPACRISREMRRMIAEESPPMILDRGDRKVEAERRPSRNRPLAGEVPIDAVAFARHPREGTQDLAPSRFEPQGTRQGRYESVPTSQPRFLRFGGRKSRRWNRCDSSEFTPAKADCVASSVSPIPPLRDHGSP